MLRTCLRALSALALALSVALLPAPDASAQKVAKYGADFLATGVGGRALGMGSTHIALASDVSAGYWNAAGLSQLDYPQIGYMHDERYAGTVSFDYGGGAFPLNERSTLGIAFFRSGVNDIKNTLDAWDSERDQPRPDAEAYISTFSAADLAFYVSYARSISGPLSVGVTGKLIRRNIGDFADAWGYSFDLAAQYRKGRFLAGVTLQDVSTMLTTWSVNADEFEGFSEVFDQAVPEGGTEIVLPVARLGGGYLVPLGGTQLTLGADLDLAFDNYGTHAFNAGSISFHPRFGGELLIADVVALRAGVSRIASSERDGFQVTPTVGAGLTVQQFQIDYGFGDFAGVSGDLGLSHRISARLTLEQPRFDRNR